MLLVRFSASDLISVWSCLLAKRYDGRQREPGSTSFSTGKMRLSVTSATQVTIAFEPLSAQFFRIFPSLSRKLYHSISWLCAVWICDLGPPIFHTLWSLFPAPGRLLPSSSWGDSGSLLGWKYFCREWLRWAQGCPHPSRFSWPHAAVWWPSWPCPSQGRLLSLFFPNESDLTAWYIPTLACTTYSCWITATHY